MSVLGLAICCEIVKSHGGVISCRSSEQVGTEFIFTASKHTCGAPRIYDSLA